MSKAIKEKIGVSMLFNDDPVLFSALNQYRISQGWTWKRFFLLSVGDKIGKDSPDLVLAIANYVENHR